AMNADHTGNGHLRHLQFFSIIASEARWNAPVTARLRLLTGHDRDASHKTGINSGFTRRFAKVRNGQSPGLAPSGEARLTVATRTPIARPAERRLRFECRRR